MKEIRICENCNHHNDVSHLECERCGFDLSMVVPTVENNESETFNIEIIPNQEAVCMPNTWAIAPTKDPKMITRIESKLFVGRTDSPLSEYLNKSNFISRNHAQLLIVDNHLCVIDASTNGTFVNGRRIPKMVETVLELNDEVCFADISFKVLLSDAN